MLNLIIYYLTIFMIENARNSKAIFLLTNLEQQSKNITYLHSTRRNTFLFFVD